MNSISIDQVALDFAVLRRSHSLFEPDLELQDAALREAISGKRFLIVGGGGTIGSATTTLLADFEPAAMHVVDQSENYLAELVRDLRGRPGGLSVRDFRTLPLDYGSPVMGRYLADTASFDVVLNFAALKHVRSEKDVYSLLQMIDTNVVRHIRFRSWLQASGHGTRYFAVSTDKAANPTSLMGASKRLMEDVLFDESLAVPGVRTSARFANVAFSNGSLLQGFLARLAKRQPLAAPRNTARYFVSQKESGQICLLASMLGRSNTLLFPRLDPRSELQPLENVASRVLEAAGFEAVPFESEEEARNAVSRLMPKKQYPLLLTPLDTSGEKPYEEFVGQDESLADSGLQTLAAVNHAPTRALTRDVIAMLQDAVQQVDVAVDKQGIVDAIQKAVPGFNHRETGKSLDDRL